MALDNKVKLPALLSFHEKIYQRWAWRAWHTCTGGDMHGCQASAGCHCSACRGFTMECGYNHYQRLMRQFDIVVDVFLGLEPHFQRVIADITRQMGHGMAEFITKDVSGWRESSRWFSKQHTSVGHPGCALLVVQATQQMSAAFSTSQVMATLHACWHENVCPRT